MDAMRLLNEFTSGQVYEPWQSTSHTPFEINEYQYMKYALADLESSRNTEKPSTHDLVNAVGNAKRALHCRVDVILDFWGILPIAKDKRWGFPAKLDKLEEGGVVTPSLLRRINTYRNAAEHDFAKPGIDTVTDFVDVVSLFLEASQKYIQSEILATMETEASAEESAADWEKVEGPDSPGEGENPWLGAAREWVEFRLDRSQAEIVLKYCLPVDAGNEPEKGTVSIKATEDLPMFLQALNAWHTRLAWELLPQAYRELN